MVQSYSVLIIGSVVISVVVIIKRDTCTIYIAGNCWKGPIFAVHVIY